MRIFSLLLLILRDDRNRFPSSFLATYVWKQETFQQFRALYICFNEAIY